jgi:guanylate kinase
MVSGALALYGAALAGKHTVTMALSALHRRYQRFAWVKCGPGSQHGYRVVTTRQLATLHRMPGEVLWETPRDDDTGTYLIDRTHLAAMVANAEVPIVHFDQPSAVEAVTAATPQLRWRVVELWCPREIAAARITQSDPKDAQRCLAAYDETPPLVDPQLWVDTSKVSPARAAKQIHALFADARDSYFVTPEISSRAARYPLHREP